MAAKQRPADGGDDEPTLPAPESSPEVMDTAEAAAFLRIKPRTLSNMAQRGEVPARKVGRSWRYSRPGLHRWLSGELDARADGGDDQRHG